MINNKLLKMNKENEFNLNLSYNSHEENPFISISNKSKSNSSNNQKMPEKKIDENMEIINEEEEKKKRRRK